MISWMCNYSFVSFAGHKNHRNGIKKPRTHRYPSLKGVRTVCCVGVLVTIFCLVIELIG